jgi:N6-adenosine-specific RNA methylase IME4
MKDPSASQDFQDARKEIAQRAIEEKPQQDLFVNVVYGRLLESAHFGGYAAERAAKEFKWLLEKDRWKEIGNGFEDIDIFLSTINLAQYRISIYDRKEIVELLNTARATQRATAKALGVSQPTIKRDLDTNVSKESKPHQSNQQDTETLDTNVSKESNWTNFQSPPSAVVAALDKDIKRKEKKAARKDLERPAPNLPTGEFALILADPPWRYEHVEAEGRAIENQYPTMSIEEICAMKVPAANDCVLFLWATSPKLLEGMAVLEAWGFTYKTCAIWDKEMIGMGYYFRQQHELLLVATKGTPPIPDPSDRLSSVIRAKRGKHSSKPDKAFIAIESMYPKLTEEHKIELFQREPRSGWAGWGNE